MKKWLAAAILLWLSLSGEARAQAPAPASTGVPASERSGSR